MEKFVALCLWLLVLTAPVVPPEASAAVYNITDLGATLGSRSYAHGINDLGQVVGYWDTGTNGFHGFLYSFGAWTDLGALGGTNSYALSINAAGEVVGFAEGADGLRAFHYRHGWLFDLGTLGGRHSYAFGINSAGQIVGYIDTAKGARAFLYQNGAAASLGTLGGTNSYAFGINSAAQIVGASDVKGSAAPRAFLWQNGQLIDLNEQLLPGSGWMLLEARGINDSGAIVGWGYCNGQERAFLFQDGGVTDLGWLAGATNSFAHGLNGANAVVGACEFPDGSMRPFLWEQGVLRDLNELLPAGSSWELREARGINDQGQIVGWGVTNGQEHAFLLNPLSALSGERAEARMTLAVGGGGAVTNLPLADAHVVGAAPNSNFGLATLLEAQTVAAGTNRDAYFTFSIANAPMPIGSAKLRLYALLSGSGTITGMVHAVADTNWVETAITWNNRPALGAVLTNKIISGNKGVWYEFDVTGYARAEQTAGREIISFGLHGSTNATRYVKINSRQNSSNKPQLVVLPNTAPAVSITSPTNNASFRSPTNVTITATAIDTNGVVVSVEFFAGSQFLGTDTTSPYSVVWNGAPVGVHALTARATDDLGVVRTSAVVTIRVTTNLVAIADAHVTSASPTLNFGTNTVLEVQTNGTSGPTRDTYLKFNLAGVGNIAVAKLRMWASASGNSACSGTAYTVADTNWVETTITWNTRPALGTALGHMRVTSTTPAWFEIDVSNYLKAEQAAGRQLISLAIHSQTNNSKFIKISSRQAVSNRVELAIVTTNGPPIVQLISPAPNAVFGAPANVEISASASDDGTISQVEFFEGATSLGVRVEPPYTLVWSGVGAGSYVLSARATDNLGLAATSAPVTITVDTPPTVALLEPPAGAFYAAPADVLLGASAANNNGPVTRVDFYGNGAKLGESSQDPFQFTWVNAPVGTSTVWAVAFEGNGLSAASPNVELLVDDRLPSSWLIQYFGADYPTNPQAHPEADPDGDGLSNYLEYVQGRHPLAGAVPDLNGVVNLRVFTPLK